MPVMGEWLYSFRLCASRCSPCQFVMILKGPSCFYHEMSQLPRALCYRPGPGCARLAVCVTTSTEPIPSQCTVIIVRYATLEKLKDGLVLPSDAPVYHAQLVA